GQGERGARGGWLDGGARRSAGDAPRADAVVRPQEGGATMSAPTTDAIETLRVRGPARALDGDVTVPGDKSIGHRAVLFAAIADGRASVRGLSGGEDNRSTIGVLRALGVAITDVAPGVVEVDGRG